jgi:hypothetical protein
VKGFKEDQQISVVLSAATFWGGFLRRFPLNDYGSHFGAASDWFVWAGGCGCILFRHEAVSKKEILSKHD